MNSCDKQFSAGVINSAQKHQDEASHCFLFFFFLPQTKSLLHIWSSGSKIQCSSLVILIILSISIGIVGICFFLSFIPTCNSLKLRLILWDRHKYCSSIFNSAWFVCLLPLVSLCWCCAQSAASKKNVPLKVAVVREVHFSWKSLFASMEEASCKKHWVSVTESVVTRKDISYNWKYLWGNTTAVTVLNVQHNLFVKINGENERMHQPCLHSSLTAG